ncbi:MAG: DUF3426 domain-containing protein [Massilia sp.]
MALATQCPHCHTTFRVAADQLKLRGGIVRCGACKEVFDGNAALVDLDAPPAPVVAVAANEALSHSDAFDAEMAELEARQKEAEQAAAKAAADKAHAEEAASSEPIYTLDFDTTFDPLDFLPKKPGTPASATSQAPDPHEAEIVRAVSQLSEAEVGRAIDELLDAEQFEAEAPTVDAALADVALTDEELARAGLAEPAPQAEPAQTLAADTPETAPDEAPHTEIQIELSDAEPPPAKKPAADGLAPMLMRASSAATEPIAPPPPAIPPLAQAPARKKRKTPAAAPRIEPAPAPVEVDEPEFVRQSRIEEETGRTRRLAMAGGAALLALLLVLQAGVTFRNVLAARSPALKPVLAALCAPFGCKVELPAQIEALSVEAGELQPAGNGTFQFTSLLRNQSDLSQAWPHLALELTDDNNKPLVRRVFAPADYLPAGSVAAKGFGARSEQPVRLHFELNQLKASGYNIAVFYP